MVVTKIRKKSFDVEAVPGERYGVDRDGYTVQSCTCSCTEKVSTELRKIVEAINNLDKSEVAFLEYRDLLYRKHAIINGCRKTHIKKVWVGYN